MQSAHAHTELENTYKRDSLRTNTHLGMKILHQIPYSYSLWWWSCTGAPCGSVCDGCDPTWEGSDHTREHIPVLAYGAGVSAGSLGQRETFADIGRSLARFFDLTPMDYGKSFLTN